MRVFGIVILTSMFVFACACACAQEAVPVLPDNGVHIADTIEDHYEARPFDASRNASDDVDIALANAKANGTKVLIVMGANWCHDSRSLAGKFEDPALKPILDHHYELVYVDVGVKSGQKDANPQIAERFDVGPIVGTPTIVIATEDRAVLNSDSTGYWRHSATIPLDVVAAYFEQYGVGRFGG